jgi:hypothetical protein
MICVPTIPNILHDVLFSLTARSLTTPSVNAVLRASRTVPIVFTQVTDPVAQGLVESLDRPGGSITGFTIFEPEIGSKMVQVLKEIAPETARVAVIFNPDTAPYYKLYMSDYPVSDVASKSRTLISFVRGCSSTARRSRSVGECNFRGHDGLNGVGRAKMAAPLMQTS